MTFGKLLNHSGPFLSCKLDITTHLYQRLIVGIIGVNVYENLRAMPGHRVGTIYMFDLGDKNSHYYAVIYWTFNKSTQS